MNLRNLLGLAGALAVMAGGPRHELAAAPAVPTLLTPAGQQLEAAYAEQLKLLQAEISKVVPSVDEGKNSALQAARTAVTKAKADVAAAQKPLDNLAGAAGLVGHRKNKWIAGAGGGDGG
jgi:hypothetical protein